MADLNSRGDVSVQPGSMKTITEKKLVAFAVGQQKKSRFQKAREEKEAKRKLDDEEAAKVYDSFVESFNVDGSSTGDFVRGAAGGGGEAGTGPASAYRIDGGRGSGRKMTEMESLMSEMKNSRNDSSGGVGGGGNKGTAGTRQIDEFMNELKMKQEGGGAAGVGNNLDYNSNMSVYGAGASLSIGDQGSSSAYMHMPPQKGSFDTGDPTTTNLHVGNLNPATTEEHLMELFGEFGEINSVKVMWPRTEEERQRKRNSGFVSFRKRHDAEEAKLEMHEFDFQDYKMQVGWSKAVKINSVALKLPKHTSSEVSSARKEKKRKLAAGSIAATASAGTADSTGTHAVAPTAVMTASQVDFSSVSVDDFMNSILSSSKNNVNASSNSISSDGNYSSNDVATTGINNDIDDKHVPTASSATIHGENEKNEEEGKDEEEDEDDDDEECVSDDDDPGPPDAEEEALLKAERLKNAVHIVAPPTFQSSSTSTSEEGKQQQLYSRAVIDLLAKYVAADGLAFEKVRYIFSEKHIRMCVYC